MANVEQLTQANKFSIFSTELSAQYIIFSMYF